MPTEPIHHAYHTDMNNMAAAIAHYFPGCTFCLLIAPPKGPAGGRVNYISNASNRADMRALLKEFLARESGQKLESGHA